MNTFHGPKSKCYCGHTGDGPGSQHDDEITPGHGKCKECACTQFSWKGYTDAYREWRISGRQPVGHAPPLPETQARLARKRKFR